jgi:hypothetical protein
MILTCKKIKLKIYRILLNLKTKIMLFQLILKIVKEINHLNTKRKTILNNLICKEINQILIFKIKNKSSIIIEK